MEPQLLRPQDPELGNWWISIIIGFIIFVVFMTLTFERDFLFEGRLAPESGSPRTGHGVWLERDGLPNS